MTVHKMLCIVSIVCVVSQPDLCSQGRGGQACGRHRVGQVGDDDVVGGGGGGLQQHRCIQIEASASLGVIVHLVDRP